MPICINLGRNNQHSTLHHLVAEVRHILLFQFVRALHVFDVHADVVLDVRRRSAGVCVEVLEDDAGPVRVVLQKLQGSAHQTALAGDRLELVQV